MTMTGETRELTTVDARRELTKLPEKLAADPATVAVTRRVKPVLAIMTFVPDPNHQRDGNSSRQHRMLLVWHICATGVA